MEALFVVFLNAKGGYKMREQLEGLKQEALAKVTAAQSEKELQDVRVAYLGKKRSDHGSITWDGEVIC